MFGHEPVSTLLIEDGANSAWCIPALLSNARTSWVQLTRAADLQQGLAALAATSFDIVLFTLPSKDRDIHSMDLIRAGRAKCPIIVLGELDDLSLAKLAIEGGAADYLAREQCDENVLARAIHYAVVRVTDLKKMQEALADERNLLRSLIDSVPDHIYVKDTRHRFVLANLAAQRFLGMTAEELVGKSDQDLFSSDVASWFQWEEELVLRSGQSSINREELITAPDGSQRWNLTTKVPLRDKRSNIIGLVGINRDITARKQIIGQLERTNTILERRERELLAAVEDLKQSHEALESTQLQLLQVEKMESVGRLAAGIAHEVKNPLAIISTGIDYLTKDAAGEGPEALARVLGSMGRAVRRADTVIRGLLDFSAPAPLLAEPCDLNGVIRQALVLVAHELRRCHVSLRVELAESLPQVSIDANKFEQVFLNLFMNSIHAMPTGGAMTVRTRTEQLAALGHNISDHRAERFRAGDLVVITEVDDSGHGIPEDKLPKVFDPFFTTKPTGKGTGLGLSVAKTIVDLHGGMLQLINRPEGGVRASLMLKATGDFNHDTTDLPDENASVDRGRRAGLHAHDGHGASTDRAV